uniref:Uncharacterized protein n=1 Tax=Arundo donax TaxID=35708 RepID=A0A0A9BEG9_ARUDO
MHGGTCARSLDTSTKTATPSSMRFSPTSPSSMALCPRR